VTNPAPIGREAHYRSLVKAISWRITGSIDTFLLSWLITGDVRAAGLISAAEVFTKIILYYLHERVWQYIPLGRYRKNKSPETND
jgi:uncharacterized membrane protein